LNKESQRNYEKSLAEEIQKIHERTKGLTIVILNRVRRAQDVAATLSELYKDQEDPPDITLMHSRFRPSERSRFEALLGTLADGKTRNRILVATQVVEAGVDISASTLITELAPWSSLVQRFGRLNRFGEIDGAKAYWVDIEWKWMEESKEKAEPKLALPYEGSELETSKVILNGLADVGPGGLKSVDAPSIVESCPLLRKKDILELFDTTPDLSGSDVDVSQYIRKADNLDVHVFWRRWEGEHPPNDEPTPHPEELCPVLLGEMKDFLKVKDNAAWVWEIFDSLWQRCEIANLRPGLTLLLSTEAGGYDIELGWVGERGKKPVEPVEHKQKSLAEAVGDDPAAETQGYLSILDHSNDIVAELEQIFAEVKLNGLPKEDLVTAARWHDRGKAHPVFQNAIAEDMEKLNRTEWAKAPSMGPYKRRCFRHELASALALLLYGGSNLSAYLVAAHHGKVRLSIRSLPTESIPPGNRRFARGVWDDDLLPAVELGGGVIAPEVTLSLQMMELGKSEEYGPSWLERILKLLGSEGPFRLAYLESLLRVADWRASDVSGKESHGLQ
jgi:CRISPR-associated endonuclease/helicase Cas3